MARFCCENCGASFSTLTPVRAQPCFCNLGCAARARVPVDTTGNFPVNRHLVAVLVIGLLFFNELLTAGFSLWLADRGRGTPAVQLAWLSLAIGFLIWTATLVLQRREKVERGKDHVIGGLVFSMLFVSIWKTEPRAGLAAAAIGALLIWNFRGLLRSRGRDEPR